MWVVLQYAVAAIFITSNALTIAEGGLGFPAITHLFGARALDTAIGCSVALAVFHFTVRRAAHRQLRSEMARTLAAAQRVLRGLSHGATTAPEALEARRDLQHQTITLQQVFEADAPALKHNSPLSRTLGSAAAVTQRLAYRLLNACWEQEAEVGPNAPPAALTTTRFEDYSLALERLEALRLHLDGDTSPRWPQSDAVFLHDEIDALARSCTNHIDRHAAKRSAAVRCGAVQCGAVRCGAVRCGAEIIDTMAPTHISQRSSTSNVYVSSY
ncbi:FUSC family protein [Burkholderia multivorans]|nr:FUSC family protein [Burkholderia multivorans]